MKFFSWIFLLAGFVACDNARGADIVGLITFKGTPPAEKEIAPIMDNADCAASYKTAPTTRFYVVGPKANWPM